MTTPKNAGRWRPVLCCALTAWALSACARSDSLRGLGSSSEWPTSTPEAQGLDSTGLLRLGEAIDRSGEDVHSVLVIRHGKLVLEAYAYPFTPADKHMLASCTKSFTAALVGIAIDRGAIRSVDQSLLDFFPEYRGADAAAKRAVRLSHLLAMTSGLDWPSRGPDDATKKMNVSPDWIGFVLSRPMAQPPGEVWNYNNGTSHLLSAIIQRATGERTDVFAVKNLFAPLGFANIMWETNVQGTTVGCAGLYLRSRDMAKLGQLYLQNGVWNGQRIVSASWIRASWTPQSAEAYGYQWWLDPGLGLYQAWGYGGNRIAVIPRLDLVVVLTGGFKDSHGDPFSRRLFKDLIIPAVRSDGPLPEDRAAQARLTGWAEGMNAGPRPRPHTTPPLAAAISGRTYGLEPNAFDLRSLRLVFDGQSGAKVELRSRMLSGTYPVGLDGRFRITEVKSLNRSHAFRGSWTSADTFSLEGLIVDFGYRYVFDCRFAGDEAEIRARAVIEDLDERIPARSGSR